MEVINYIINENSDLIIVKLKLRFNDVEVDLNFNCFYWKDEVPKEEHVVQHGRYTISETFTHICIKDPEGKIVSYTPSFDKYQKALKVFKKLIRKEKLHQIR